MKRHIPRWFVMAILVFVLSVLLASCVRASVHQMLISPLATATTDTTTKVDLDPLYTASYYEFKPPAGWTVMEANKGEWVTLLPPSNAPLSNKIELAILNYDMKPGDDLLAWSRLYAHAAGGDVAQIKIISQTSETSADSNIQQQVLHRRMMTRNGFVESVLISNGELVLEAATFLDTPAASETLLAVAQTIDFPAGAPTNHYTMEGWQDSEDTTLDPVLAGETYLTFPHADLAIKDAEARYHPTPATPYLPGEVFVQVAATHNALLESGQIIRNLPSATETPTPPIVAILMNDNYPGRRVLQLREPLSDSLVFYLAFSTTNWTLNATTLAHRDLNGCMLNLSELGRGFAGPANEAAVRIGNVEWLVSHKPDGKLVSYSMSPFVFAMHYNVEPENPAFARCRDAVEEVLATFRPVQ